MKVKKEFIKDCGRKIKKMPPDIQERIKENTLLAYDLLMEEVSGNDEDTEHLKALIETRYRYFDKGYWCELTPEELKQEIEAFNFFVN